MSFITMIPNPIIIDILNDKKYRARKGWVDIEIIGEPSNTFHELLVHRVFLKEKSLKMFRIGYPVLISTNKGVWPGMIKGFALEPHNLKRHQANPYTFRIMVIDMLLFIEYVEAIRSFLDGIKNKKSIK